MVSESNYINCFVVNSSVVSESRMMISHITVNFIDVHMCEKFNQVLVYYNGTLTIKKCQKRTIYGVIF